MSWYSANDAMFAIVALILIGVQVHQHRRLLKVERIVWPLSSKGK